MARVPRKLLPQFDADGLAACSREASLSLPILEFVPVESLKPDAGRSFFASVRKLVSRSIGKTVDEYEGFPVDDLLECFDLHDYSPKNVKEVKGKLTFDCALSNFPFRVAVDMLDDDKCSACRLFAKVQRFSDEKNNERNCSEFWVKFCQERKYTIVIGDIFLFGMSKDAVGAYLLRWREELPRYA